MIRVRVVCEGETELEFVETSLAPALLPETHCYAVLPGKARTGRGRGGDLKYDRVFPDILCALKQDRRAYCTTLFDYYRLGPGFPRDGMPPGDEPEQRASRVERAVERDIARRMGTDFNPRRFRCFVAMHEFEGLLFSDPGALAGSLRRHDLEEALVAIRCEVSTPEHIDDGPETAPSKRLKALMPRYDKVIDGNRAALAVGLNAMRRECARFNAWMGWLEGLA